MFIEYLSLFHSRLIKHELGKDKKFIFQGMRVGMIMNGGC
jgi:hypothetical protein